MELPPLSDEISAANTPDTPTSQASPQQQQQQPASGGRGIISGGGNGGSFNVNGHQAVLQITRKNGVYNLAFRSQIQLINSTQTQIPIHLSSAVTAPSSFEMQPYGDRYLVGLLGLSAALIYKPTETARSLSLSHTHTTHTSSQYPFNNPLKVFGKNTTKSCTSTED